MMELAINIDYPYASRQAGGLASSANWSRLFAENLESGLAQLLGVALAVFPSDLDDEPGYRGRHGVLAIHQAERFQRGVEYCRQDRNFFRSEYRTVIGFKNRPDRHGQTP